MKQDFKWFYLLFIALLFTNSASAKYPEKTIKSLCHLLQVAQQTLLAAS